MSWESQEQLVASLITAGRLKEAEAICRDLLAVGSVENELSRIQIQLNLSIILTRLTEFNEAYALAAEIIVWSKMPGTSSVDRELKLKLGAQAALLALAIGAEFAGIALSPNSSSNNVDKDQLEQLAKAASESEELIKDFGDDAMTCRFLMLKAAIEYQLQDSVKAENYLIRAADMAKRSEDPELMTAVGLFFTQLGDASRALDVLEDTEVPQDKFFEINLHLSLAVEMSEADPPNVQEALRHIQLAVRVAESSEYFEHKVRCLMFHADMAGEFEQWDQVIYALKRLVSLIQEASQSPTDTTERLLEQFVGALEARLPWRESLKAAKEGLEKATEATRLIVEVFKAIETEESLGVAHDIEARLGNESA